MSAVIWIVYKHLHNGTVALGRMSCCFHIPGHRIVDCVGHEQTKKGCWGKLQAISINRQRLLIKIYLGCFLESLRFS